MVGSTSGIGRFDHRLSLSKARNPNRPKEPGRDLCLPVRNDKTGCHCGRDSGGNLRRMPAMAGELV